MKARTAIGLVMLLLECIVVWYATDRVVLAAAVFGTALLLAAAGRRFPIAGDRYPWLVIALAVAALLWGVLAPPRLESGLMFFSGAAPMFYVAAIFCIGHQALQTIVVVRHPFRDMPGPFPSFPLEGVFVLATAGHFDYWANHHMTYLAVVAVFVALTGLYYLVGQNEWLFARYSATMKVLSAGLLALFIGTGAAAGVAMQRNEPRINAWLDSLTIGPSANSALGFSREGRLTNVAERRSAADQSPALFVTSDKIPGYLRGLVFDAYRDARWLLPNPETWLFAEDPVSGRRLPTDGNRVRFQLVPEAPRAAGDRMEILTTTELLDAVFMPATATELFIQTEGIALDSAGSVRETKPERRPGYAVVEAAAPPVAPLSEFERKRYTAVPESLDPRVRDLAEHITAGLDSPRDKAAAIEAYFIGTYDYQLGIRVPPGRDPLTYFLLEKPPAHCEYFASGAALLLRVAGVPARYVTGFVATERNSTGNFFVARNKDAHAWVEAWDPHSGWFIVEATPPAGVPQPRSADAWSDWRDALNLAWLRFRDGFNPNALNDLVSTFAAVVAAAITSTFGMVLLATLTGCATLHLLWRRLRARPPTAEREELRRLRALLKRADAVAASAGLARAENETLHSFAHRLAGAADDRRLAELAEWYREYERVRYRDTANDSAHTFLASALPSQT